MPPTPPSRSALTERNINALSLTTQTLVGRTTSRSDVSKTTAGPQRSRFLVIANIHPTNEQLLFPMNYRSCVIEADNVRSSLSCYNFCFLLARNNVNGRLISFRRLARRRHVDILLISPIKQRNSHISLVIRGSSVLQCRGVHSGNRGSCFGCSS